MRGHRRHSVEHIEHHIICRHQVEVAVWPPSAEVYYRDEPTVDPVNTQVRFDATVFNASSGGVTWSIHDPSGGPGAGSIDQAGLYTAPPKGAAPFVRTVIVVATSVEDPMRLATAFVTLVDAIPLPAPKPAIDVFPRHSVLYFNTTSDKNRYIDPSNKRQVFEAVVHRHDAPSVSWTLSGLGSLSTLATEPAGALYVAPSGGTTGMTAIITATLNTVPPITAKADILLLSYTWPYPA